MYWQTPCFKDDPLKTAPIASETLVLYTGHNHEIKVCQNVLTSSNVRIVIEGARGVGTTSFGNYLRFTAQDDKRYFTTRNEIKVDQGWIGLVPEGTKKVLLKINAKNRLTNL